MSRRGESHTDTENNLQGSFLDLKTQKRIFLPEWFETCKISFILIGAGR